MKVVLLGGGGLQLIERLADGLRAAHEVAISPAADRRDLDLIRRTVGGADAVIDLAPLSLASDSDPASTSDALDQATRGTYTLLRAAIEAGLRRVVLASTLAVMERYPASWRVAESWRPRPDVTRLSQIGAYLAEESARQLSRDGGLTTVCLRLGEVVDDSSTVGRDYDTRWLHLDDALQAFERALQAPLRRGWWVFHIPGGGRHTRVPLAGAALPGGLDYRPGHDFAGSPGAAEPPTPPSQVEAAGPLAARPP